MDVIGFIKGFYGARVIDIAVLCENSVLSFKHLVFGDTTEDAKVSASSVVLVLAFLSLHRIRFPK